jgi:hypothetical protein
MGRQSQLSPAYGEHTRTQGGNDSQTFKKRLKKWFFGTSNDLKSNSNDESFYNKNDIQSLQEKFTDHDLLPDYTSDTLDNVKYKNHRNVKEVKRRSLQSATTRSARYSPITIDDPVSAKTIVGNSDARNISSPTSDDMKSSSSPNDRNRNVAIHNNRTPYNAPSDGRFSNSDFETIYSRSVDNSPAVEDEKFACGKISTLLLSNDECRHHSLQHQ